MGKESPFPKVPHKIPHNSTMKNVHTLIEKFHPLEDSAAEKRRRLHDKEMMYRHAFQEFDRAVDLLFKNGNYDKVWDR